MGVTRHNERYDVAVVGAGPAGALAAYGVARAGGRAVLVEQQALPRYKTCGGGVVGRAIAQLPPGAAIDWQQQCHLAEVLFEPLGLRYEVRRDVPVVAMTMRADFDRALVDLAIEAGAELVEDCAAHEVRHRGRHVELVTARGVVDTEFIVAADGALSPTARNAGWHEPPLLVPALEWEVRVPEEVLAAFSDRARFDIGAIDGGYGWVFPKKEHLSVGLLSMRRGARGLKSSLNAYLDAVGVEPRLDVEAHGALVPVRPREGGLVKGRVLLAGDAAGLADPITGEGIWAALTSGSLAAGAIVDGKGDPWHVQHLYESTMQDQVLSELRLARWLARILYRMPRARAWLLQRAGNGFSEAMASVITGERSYHDLVWSVRNLWRLLRGHDLTPPTASAPTE